MNNTISRVKKYWINYWFSTVSPVGFAMFRIAFGCVLLLYHLPRLWYIEDLYTNAGYLFPMHWFYILHLPIPSLMAAWILNIILFLAIICFIIGYRTKYSAITIFALHSYFSVLERFSTKGYGSIMIIYALLLIWSPSGKFLSIDSMIERFRQIIKSASLQDRLTYARVPITMQRIMLIQLAQIYFFNAFSKILHGGWGWFNGENLLNIYRNTGAFARPFVLPLLQAVPYLSVLLGVLIPGTLLFIAWGLLGRNNRLYAIAFGIIYHGVVLFTTTVPYVFTFLMFSLYMIAIEPDTWERWWSRLVRYYGNKHVTFFYDDTCALCFRVMACIRAADTLERIQYVSISSISSPALTIAGKEIHREKLLQSIHLVLADGRILTGFFAFRAAVRIVPFFWIFVPLFYLPGARWMGEKIYSLIARNRKNICKACI